MTRDEQIAEKSKQRHLEKYNQEGFCPEFEIGAKWADETMIEKACKWLEENIAESTGIDSYTITESFKQAMMS